MVSFRKLMAWGLMLATNFTIAANAPTKADPRILDEMLNALKTLQDKYFEPWQGTWPSAIDWTAAVVGTHVAGALASLSHSLSKVQARSDDDRAKENLVALYFSQVLGFYFGQDHVSIRAQAYDDMLWVVLGWLEMVQFIELHSELYFPSPGAKGPGAAELPPLPGQTTLDRQDKNRPYFGNVWTPAFAHRARVFWELAAKGWDTQYCGGGMNWNPRLLVYKNAITNELFIAASASMYLHFPGDDNTSPFDSGRRGVGDGRGARDIRHLQAAIAGHAWLRNSGMLNGPGQYPEGLYVDGYHISGLEDPNSNNTKCDARNNQVYTYNQGVILTGLRGLWKATGDEAYIREGHELISNVIKATGYDLKQDKPVDPISDLKPGQLPPWHGLGRAGVLEENCDVAGTCSADSQTFKGNFFHHFTAFCAPLAASSKAGFHGTHFDTCSSYHGWLAQNAKAAMGTRDSDGKFGMWWTPGLLDLVAEDVPEGHKNQLGNKNKAPDALKSRTTDYRSFGVPAGLPWRLAGQEVSKPPGKLLHRSPSEQIHARDVQSSRGSDPNSRHRGRTVETQASGLAVLRALWEVSNLGS